MASAGVAPNCFAGNLEVSPPHRQRALQVESQQPPLPHLSKLNSHPHRQDACIPMRVRYAADIDLNMAAKSQERDPEQHCADEG